MANGSLARSAASKRRKRHPISGQWNLLSHYQQVQWLFGQQLRHISKVHASLHPPSQKEPRNFRAGQSKGAGLIRLVGLFLEPPFFCPAMTLLFINYIVIATYYDNPCMESKPLADQLCMLETTCGSVGLGFIPPNEIHLKACTSSWWGPSETDPSMAIFKL